MFLFSDRTCVNRMLMTKLAHLLYDATPIQRLAIIEAIEETGNVLFALTAGLARRIEAQEQVTLVFRYFEEWTQELLTFATAELDASALQATTDLVQLRRA